MGISETVFGSGGYDDFKNIFKVRDKFIFEKDFIIILNPNENTRAVLNKYEIEIQQITDYDVADEGSAITYFDLLSNSELLNLIFSKHKFADIPNMVIGIANTIKDLPEFRELLNIICDRLDNEEIAYLIYKDIKDEEFRVYMQMKFGGFPNCK